MMSVEQAEQREHRKRDREATRRRILDAARDLFGEHGYEGVTVRMIASAADANTALVNRYFGSKAALFGEVLAGAGDEDERGVVGHQPAEPGGELVAQRVGDSAGEVSGGEAGEGADIDDQRALVPQPAHLGGGERREAGAPSRTAGPRRLASARRAK